VSPAPGPLHPGHRKSVQLTVRSNGLIESTNTKIHVLARIAFGFTKPEALIAPGHARPRRLLLTTRPSDHEMTHRSGRGAGNLP
jgi:Transposase